MLCNNFKAQYSHFFSPSKTKPSDTTSSKNKRKHTMSIFGTQKRFFSLFLLAETKSSSDRKATFQCLCARRVQLFNDLTSLNPRAVEDGPDIKRKLGTINVSFWDCLKNCKTVRQHSAQESNCYRGKRYQQTNQPTRLEICEVKQHFSIVETGNRIGVK